MVEYIQEDLWELAAKIPSYRADSIAADLSMHGIDAKGWGIEPEHIKLFAEGKNIFLTPYDNIPNYIGLRYFLYKEPLESMPPYINDAVEMKRIIATWRLSIAK